MECEKKCVKSTLVCRTDNLMASARDDAVLHVAERHVVHSRCLKRFLHGAVISAVCAIYRVGTSPGHEVPCKQTALSSGTARSPFSCTLPHRCKNPRQPSFHDLHALARCVHLRTDVQPYHKHRVEGPHHARTASITTVPHRSRHPVLETPCSA